MGHRRRRISRILLGVLGLTIAVGVFTYARRPTSTRAGETAAAGTAPTTEPQKEADPKPAPPVSTAVASAADVVLPEPATTAPVALPGQPLRTETPAALVTETPAPGTAVVKAPAQEFAAAPKPAAPAADSGKVTIKPYPPAPAASPTPAPTRAPVAGAEAIREGRSLMQSGKVLEARDQVNAALASGRLNDADAEQAKALLSELNQTVVFSTRKFADDRWGGTYQVVSGDRLDRIGAKYGLTSDLLLKLNGLSDARRLRANSYIKVLKGPFHAVVSKSRFRIELYLGAPGGPESLYVTSFPVGLGKDNSTPLGKWKVEPDRKVKNPVYYSPRGEGVVEADDPKNPLGEFWIGLVGLDGEAVGKESYGIHGTIEPDSIGKMASMGCIRLKNEDVAQVFAALVEGKSTVLVVQ